MPANISSVIASASLSGSQYKTIDSAVQTLTNLHLAPVDIAAAAKGVQDVTTITDAVGAGISAAKAGLSLVEAAVKAIPGAGTALNLSSLATNLTKASNEQSGAGITNGTALGLAGDIAALLATASGLVLTGPAGMALFVGLTAISAGFTIAGLLNPSTVGDPLFQDALAPTTLPYLPSGISDFDFWTIPGGVGSQALSPTIGTTPDPKVKVKVVRYVDPLILDLDGDGLEISPMSKGVLFDANGDTIKTGTAWAASDDGMLVWDRNGNGLIDSGGELFGDETVLTTGPNAGKKAANGFVALAELDSNADGKFDLSDAQYASLRIWRDMNQDGISQTDELQTLADTGVKSIGLTNATVNTNYTDAILAQSGSFTRMDNSTGQAGSFILAQNNFVRAFAPIAVCVDAKYLQDAA